jgi:glycosyltransferase involved in cell wall biosynthesis
MKTKVCLAITKGVWGGAQEYVYTLATSLPRDTYDVCVICGEGRTLQDKLTSAGIKIINIPSLTRDIFFVNEIKSFFTLLTIIRRESPDILHLNSSKMGLLGGLVGRLIGVKKIIFTAHGWAFNESRPWIVRKIFYYTQWLTVLLSHTTIAVSQKTKHDIRKLLWIKDKIKVIHNGIAPIDFVSKIDAREHVRQLVRLSHTTEIMIGTISELHPNKGLDLLIDACRNLPYNTSVYIIGDGEEKERLQEKIEGYELEHKVFLVGRVEEARRYLKAFDIFTLTSRTEALPYTLLEAGLAECAVIATRVGGIPEIITDEKTGLLIHRNIDEITHSITHLIENPEKRLHLGVNLRHDIETQFSVKQMLQKTTEIYLK